MLIDVVSPSSYLTFNVRVAHILGLANAVYCAELLDIYNKARKKNKLDNENYFIVNREYIRTRTSIKLDEQYFCDASLSKVGLITSAKDNPDKIKFDVEQFMKIVAEEDAKILDNLSAKIRTPKNLQDSRALKREHLRLELKKSITTQDLSVKSALELWVDVVFESKNVIKDTVKEFEKCLHLYSSNNVQTELGIIQTARLHGITDCVSAIELYEKAQKFLKAEITKVKSASMKIASKDNLSNKEF